MLFIMIYEAREVLPWDKKYIWQDKYKNVLIFRCQSDMSH